MKTNEIILKSLNDYLMERFKYRSPPANFGMGDTLIEARRKKFDLYLRLFRLEGGIFPKDTIVIARIGFQEERVGHGRDLVKFLKGVAIEYGFQYIGIECTNENSSAFGKKLGFHQIGNSNHYLAKLTDLSPF